MVYFIGAGPGDPELITVKGMKILSSCDVIIYAGSLVSEEILKYAKDGTEICNSASMTLEEIAEVIVKADRENKDIARLHTVDSSIYGAIHEQVVELNSEI